MKSGRGALALLGLVGLAGLAPVACKHDDRRRIVVKNEGPVCIGPAVDLDASAPQGVDLTPGRPLEIGVRTQVLSDMCSTGRKATCSVKQDGERLVVTSELSWFAPTELDVKCRGPTSVLEARCSTEALAAGNYYVIVGKRTVGLQLPGRLDKSCVGVIEEPRIAPPPTAPVATVTAPIAANAGDAAVPVGVGGAPVKLDPNIVPAAPGTGVAPQPPVGDTICIAPAAAGKDRSLKANKPIAITVLHKNLCLGAQCTTAPAKCVAKRKGSHITVTAKFPTSTTKPTKPCTDDCPTIAVTCKTEALPASLYSIELNDQRKNLQIPSALPPPCGP